MTERRRLSEGPTFQIVKVIYELEALAAQLRLLGCYGSCQDRYGFFYGMATVSGRPCGIRTRGGACSTRYPRKSDD